jgi:hypothetical protein
MIDGELQLVEAATKHDVQYWSQDLRETVPVGKIYRGKSSVPSEAKLAAICSLLFMRIF